MNTFNNNHWALILGGSSGFGLASAKKLSQQGMNVCIVHRDRRGAMATINEGFEEIRNNGVGFLSYNLDALSESGINKVLDLHGSLATWHAVTFWNVGTAFTFSFTPSSGSVILLGNQNRNRNHVREIQSIGK